MKLYQVDLMDDNDSETVLVVAESKEEAEEKVRIMDWSCLLWVNAREITKIDGYIVQLVKA